LHKDVNELKKFGYRQVLRRNLNVWQLTAFGLNYMMPLAPVIIFGLVAATSGGTVALPYILACVAMLLTANSYALMVREFPLAGSTYSYVSRGLSAKLGFLAGWVLLLDYILIPTVSAMSVSLYLHHYLTGVSPELIFVLFVLLTGSINFFGVKLMANIGLWMLLLCEVLVVASFIIWGKHIVALSQHLSSLINSKPFHFASLPHLFTATSIAVFSYLGFDAITTLSEEAKNPKRDIPRAILFSLLIGGATLVLTGYLAVLATPHIQSVLHNRDWQQTALYFISVASGGKVFAAIYMVGFVVSMAVFNVVATASASRLLFGMGRDKVLPKKFFAAIHKRYRSPYLSILFIITAEIIVGLTLSLSFISQVVNFGALFAFALLNLTVAWYFLKKPVGRIRGLFIPLLAFLIMLSILFSMNHFAFIVGCCWLFLGSFVLVLQTFN
jgi:amino acid transporter